MNDEISNSGHVYFISSKRRNSGHQGEGIKVDIAKFSSGGKKVINKQHVSFEEKFEKAYPNSLTFVGTNYRNITEMLDSHTATNTPLTLHL